MTQRTAVLPLTGMFSALACLLTANCDVVSPLSCCFTSSGAATLLGTTWPAAQSICDASPSSLRGDGVSSSQLDLVENSLFLRAKIFFVNESLRFQLC